MNDRHFAAALGFAFVAAWIGFNFGYALLCLIGAGLFWAAAGVLAGSIDLGELQDRFAGQDARSDDVPTPRKASAKPRVQ